MNVDAVGLRARELLVERTASLIAETCAWAVGLSDAPHHQLRQGRVVPTGTTLGLLAEADLPLADEQRDRLDLEDARPGSLQDALNALTSGGGVHADRFEEQVLIPFALETCVLAAMQVRERDPDGWAELLEELGEDGTDLEAVVRAGEWESPLRITAEHLALAALGHADLVAVEAEGLPLSLVRAAEFELRRAVEDPGASTPSASTPGASPPADDELAGALFLAQAALDRAGLELPVPPTSAARLIAVLLGEGLEPDEVLSLLPHLPVLQDTADAVTDQLADSA